MLLHVFFVFGRGEKGVENVQVESRTPEKSLFLGLKGAWGFL